jgi:hypothetical protein
MATQVYSQSCLCLREQELFFFGSTSVWTQGLALMPWGLTFCSDQPGPRFSYFLLSILVWDDRCTSQHPAIGDLRTLGLGLTLNHDPPDLSLPHSSDYRHEPQAPIRQPWNLGQMSWSFQLLILIYKMEFVLSGFNTRIKWDNMHIFVKIYIIFQLQHFFYLLCWNICSYTKITSESIFNMRWSKIHWILKNKLLLSNNVWKMFLLLSTIVLLEKWVQDPDLFWRDWMEYCFIFPWWSTKNCTISLKEGEFLLLKNLKTLRTQRHEFSKETTPSDIWGLLSAFLVLPK